MEDVPQMPPVPALGQATVDLVWQANEACRKRAYLSDNTSPEAKHQRGDDYVRVFQITAAAAQHAPDNPLIQALERIEAKQDAIEAKQDAMNARLDNMRRRAHNLRAFGRGSGAELQPLHRELLAAPGGAAPGELPAMAVFPATWQALGQLTNAQVDALEAFYGEPFAGGSVADRREALKKFVIE